MRVLLSGMLMMAGITACGRSAEVPTAAAAIAFDGAATTTASASAAHGKRISWALGCHGCHGDDLTGQLWDDEPQGYGVMWATNLTRAVPAMSDAQLRELLTAGHHPRRARMWVMPSELFQHLAPTDLDSLMTYLRTLKPSGEISPDPSPGPLFAKEIADGTAKDAATLASEFRAVLPADLGAATASGRYIASVTCAECHGMQLEGHKDAEGATPDLIIAGAYSRGEFERLMTTGVAKDNRKIAELMTQVAKSRFAKLTPNERDALYAYLKARAERPQ